MQVDYEVTVEDLEAFHLHVVRRLPHFRRMYATGFVMGPLMGVGLVALTGHEGVLSSLVKVIVMSAVFSAFYLYFYPKVVRDSVRKVHGQETAGLAIGPRSVSITPDGLTETSAHTTMREEWAGIRKIEATPSALYLFNGPTSAYILPTRAFIDEAQLEAFVAAVARYRNE